MKNMDLAGLPGATKHLFTTKTWTGQTAHPHMKAKLKDTKLVLINVET